jgi:putative aldouronate transport system substrate-binding protein
MKKVKINTLTAIVLCIAMLLGLVGCSSKEQASSEKEDSSSQESNEVTQEASEEETKTTDVAGYPLQTDQKLTVWSYIMGPQKSFTSYTESPFHTGLAKMTGVDVEWIFPTAGTDPAQAFNLLLASDELPDIIIYGISNDADQYMDENIIRDLTDILPEKAPNYWKYLQDNPYFDKSVKADSGRYYGFGCFRENEWNAAYTGPVIRKDWLEECGLAEPVTIADWDNVIRTFYDKYDAKFSFAISRMNPGFAGAFGASGSFAKWTDELFYIDNDQKVQFTMAQNGWMDYMSQLNSWYKDGLIDTDSLTIDDAGMRTKALNNKVGISITSMGQMTNWLADVESSGSSAKWEGLAYPVQTVGDVVMKTQMEDTARASVGAVTTSCAEDKVDIAIKWLDYFFSEEGVLYTNFGTEGETYTMVDGVPTYTDVILKAPDGTNEALDKYTCAQWQNIGIQATELVRQKNNPIAVQSVDTWLKNQESQKHIFPAGVTRTTEESYEATAIISSIQTYVQEMSLKFLTGEESFDNFASYLERLDSMGLPRLLEIQQAAYDRFLER